MQDLNDLYFFVQVVDHGGFAPAARGLGLPRSRLSRRIILLEERLGVRLIQRSTRRFSVTEIGQEYYRHCVAIAAEVYRRDGDDLRETTPSLVHQCLQNEIEILELHELIASCVEIILIEGDLVDVAALGDDEGHNILTIVFGVSNRIISRTRTDKAAIGGVLIRK